MASVMATLQISSLPAGGTFGLTIQNAGEVYWTNTIEGNGGSYLSLSGMSGTSGVLQSLNMTATSINLTNGGQTANWQIVFMVSYPTGTKEFQVMPSLSVSSGVNVELTTYGAPDQLTNGTPYQAQLPPNSYAA